MATTTTLRFASSSSVRKPLFPTLSSLRQMPSLRAEKRAAIEGARRKVFGYESGFPGEKQWLKPLEGRKLMKWYWPSKYLMPDFQVDQYFQMQANRFVPRKEHPAVAQLQRCLQLAFLLRRQLHDLFNHISPRLLLSHPSLQDLYSLHRSFGFENPLRFAVSEDVFKEHNFSWLNVDPFQGLSVLEKQFGETTEGQRKFRAFLDECRSCRSVAALHSRIIEEFQSDSATDLSDLLRLRTSEILNFPRLQSATSKRSKTTRGGLEKGEEECEEEAMMSTNSGIATANRRDGQFKEQRSGDWSGDDRGVAATETEKWLIDLGRQRKWAADDEAEEKFRQDVKEEKMAELLEALDKSPDLRNYFTTRHRFFDPSYRRRRLSFLDRLSRNRIKSEKEKTLYAGKHFAEHPDKKELWPDNKGLINRQWPSPYH